MWEGSDWGRRLRQAHPVRWAVRPPRPPRPRRDLRPVRDRRAGRGAEGPHQRLVVRRDPAGAGDPGRHARRAGSARRRRPAAHRPPGQGSRVARSWWSPTCRRAPGPTCGVATRCSAPTGSAATSCSPRRPAARCSPRSAGCSTSRSPGPASGWSSPPSRSPDDDGDQPSRFVDELGRRPEHRVGRPPRPLSMRRSGRRAAPDCWPTRPSRSRCDGRPPSGCGDWPRPTSTAVSSRRQADPSSWWGLRAPSRSARPVRPADEPLTLSASALEGLLTCPAQWFLDPRGGRRRRQLDQPGVRQGRARRGRAHRQATSSTSATT